MKKLLCLILSLCTLYTLTGAASASLYPIEATEYMQGNSPRISRIYALAATDDPATIPTEDFTRENTLYTLLDMTRSDQSTTDTKQHTAQECISSKSRDMDKILPLLVASKEVTTEDGYAGILTLDPASIKVEAAGYGNSTRTVTATRSYPNLSDADTALVPKTTNEGGRTLSLANVSWQEAGGFYHATASYTGTASSKYATGYTVTANYTGQVSKTTNDTVLYTVVFGGTAEESAEPPSLSTLLILFLLVVIAILAYHALCSGQRKQQQRRLSE